MARSQENLGLTVNGVPLNDGAGLWTPDFFHPTSRDARVTERWGGITRPKAGEVTVKKMRKRKPPSKKQMLERLQRGVG